MLVFAVYNCIANVAYKQDVVFLKIGEKFIKIGKNAVFKYKKRDLKKSAGKTIK
ncbi:MAG: hypothetical protein V4592_08910 [Bacteroidota bacterium]